MTSVNDWASKCAERIAQEYFNGVFGKRKAPSKERIAAIVATFAAPIVALLKEQERKHYHDSDDRDLCCPQCECFSWSYVADAQDAGELDAEHESNHPDKPCTCGADAWNARVDTALAGDTPVGPPNRMLKEGQRPKR